MKNCTKLLILLISISAFSQSPWTQEKGKFYMQLSFTTIPSYNTIFGDPDYTISGNITDNTIQFYGEYGLSKKTSLLLNLPYKLIMNSELVNPCLVAPCREYSNSKNSLGNIEIGIKHNFFKKVWLISSQLSIETNTGNYNENSGIRTGYNAWTFTPLFIAGKGLNGAYFQTFIGANIRTNNYSSNFKIGGEYGKKLGEKIWFIGFVDIVKSLENGEILLPAKNLNTGLYVNDQEYGAFGFKGIYEVNNNFGINAGLGGAFFGNNVAKAPALTAGIYHKF
jgi:hypothetical protein